MRHTKLMAAALAAGTAFALPACGGGGGGEANNTAVNAMETGFGNVADPSAVETMGNGSEAMNGGALGTGNAAGDGAAGGGNASGTGAAAGNSGADAGTGAGAAGRGTNVGGDAGGNAAGGTSNGM
jgi:hypothetical protein